MNEIVTAMKKIKSRNEIPGFLSRWNLNDTIAEVGVQFGYNMESLLRCDPRLAIAVDRWNNQKEQSVCDDIYLGVVRRFMNRQNVRIIRATSTQAAKLMPKGSLDFVYIDAQHSYHPCLKDITIWWPKVRQGGIIAGHDYINVEVNGKTYGVIKAVKELMTTTNIDSEMLHHTEYGARTWMLYKVGYE